VPAGTWEDDDDLLAEVSAIVGKDRRDRKVSGPAIVKELRSMAGRWLGRTLTAKEHDRLRALTLGQLKIRRALGRDDTVSRTQPLKASAIVRELLSWRHNVTDPDVRRLQRSLREPVAYDVTALVLKYEAEQPVLDADRKPVTDKDGRPILIRPPVFDEKGEPILWVPDEHGQPSRPYVAGEPLPRRPVKTVRPRVKKMIFR
jgi:hypothetical protein